MVDNTERGKMTALTEKIKPEKIIAIIRGLALNEIMKTTEALEKSGIHFIEVTFKWRSNKYCNKKDTGK